MFAAMLGGCPGELCSGSGSTPCLDFTGVFDLVILSVMLSAFLCGWWWGCVLWVSGCSFLCVAVREL